PPAGGFGVGGCDGGGVEKRKKGEGVKGIRISRIRVGFLGFSVRSDRKFYSFYLILFILPRNSHEVNPLVEEKKKAAPLAASGGVGFLG
ncbi:hypothetical protein, partial [Neolewinella agarilytica]|uniref:hypothetical protein n=1 Tax=Neolewinella agarilytica TaxID=478744 RepID=UPI0023534382